MRFSSTVLLLGFSAYAAINSVVAAPAAYPHEPVALLKRQDSSNGTDSSSDGFDGTNTDLLALVTALGQGVSDVTNDAGIVSTDFGFFAFSVEVLATLIEDPTLRSSNLTLYMQNTTNSIFDVLLNVTETLLADVSALVDAIQNAGDQLQAFGFLPDNDGDGDDGDDDS